MQSRTFLELVTRAEKNTMGLLESRKRLERSQRIRPAPRNHTHQNDPIIIA